MQRVTMQQIGEELGVSRATVSLAMRSHPSIPAATQRRVRECAQRLHYRPNPLISALMSDMRTLRGVRHTLALAYVSPYSLEETHAIPSARRYFEGAAAHAAAFGYRLDYFPFHGNPAHRDVPLEGVLVARGIPGVLLSPGRSAEYVVELPWERFCAVTIGNTLKSPNLHRSINHQSHSLNLALRKCREYGYRKVGLLFETRSDAERVEHIWEGGFLYYQAGIPKPERIPALYLDELSTTDLRAWLRKYQPDVLLLSNFLSIKRLRNAGYEFPGPVALALLDRSEAHRECAGVDQRPDLVGAGAIDLIIQSLMTNAYGLPECPKTVLIEGSWVDAPSMPRKETP